MKHIHLIGIGGTGLSAIARVLYESGNRVTGSDMEISPLARGLMDLGIHIVKGHQAENITGADFIIRSSAIPDTNPEVIAAINAGIPVLKRREFLAQLTTGKKVIAIAGTHGKTTTTSMIAFCMEKLGAEPSFIVGGDIKDLGVNARAGKGAYFIIEADEYDRMFLGLSPDILVITNIEHDHPDCFPTLEEYRQAYKDLIARIKPDGTLIINVDDSGCRSLLAEISGEFQVITYGISDHANYRVFKVLHLPQQGVQFTIENASTQAQRPPQKVTLSIPGEHNALNASAALIALELAGYALGASASAINGFSGSGRRFEVVGEANGIIFIDDYGHHPTEIQATLAAARNHYPEMQLWAVWQPHTYSRTRQLAQDFTRAFSNCDHLIVTEIYASREPLQDYSSAVLVDQMNHPDAHYISTLDETISFLKENLQPSSVVIVLSAGDAVHVNRDLSAYFKREGVGGA